MSSQGHTQSTQQQNGSSAHQTRNGITVHQQQHGSTQQQHTSTQHQPTTTHYQPVPRPWATAAERPWAGIITAHPRLHYIPGGPLTANNSSQHQLTATSLAQLEQQEGQANTLQLWEQDGRVRQREGPWDGVGSVRVERRE